MPAVFLVWIPSPPIPKGQQKSLLSVSVGLDAESAISLIESGTSFDSSTLFLMRPGYSLASVQTNFALTLSPPLLDLHGSFSAHPTPMMEPYLLRSMRHSTVPGSPTYGTPAPLPSHRHERGMLRATSPTTFAIVGARPFSTRLSFGDFLDLRNLSSTCVSKVST